MAKAKTTKSNKKKILIAEDEKPMARAFELKLNASGFDAHAVFDGESALGELQKGAYDLLLLDVVMPKLDGYGVLLGMKEKGITTPTIIATNLSQSEDLERMKAFDNVADYLIKSETSISGILERVKKVLRV